MFRSLFAIAALTALPMAAHAEVLDSVKTEITVNRAALADETRAAAEMMNIRNQAIDACRYGSDSVLSQQYDKSCAKDLVAQVVNGVQTAQVNTAAKS